MTSAPLQAASASPAENATVRASNRWETDNAWITGCIGAAAIIFCALWYGKTGVLEQGVRLFGRQLTSERTDSTLFALAIITGIMVFAELLRLWLHSGKQFLSLSPECQSRHFLKTLEISAFYYLKNLLLFWLIVVFYRWAENYGYQSGKAYFQPWFKTLDYLWLIYLWGGLPYIFVTRLFKHNAIADAKDPSILIDYLFSLLKRALPNSSAMVWTENHKKALLGLFVKIFFAPLMTVFFLDNFPHLANNLNYLSTGLWEAIDAGQYSHSRFNMDLFNLSTSLIFSIDLGIAWVGYVVSSRWVDNQTKSTEPTLLGWLVCICCYPPFQLYIGLYYAAPGERDVLNFSHQWLTTLFTLMMVSSYLVYMSATLWFGVRFSNLTNRGIIRTGPFALIRHPAYASKNFAWWCVMFPVIVFNATSNFKLAVVQIAGLCFMTLVYYLRAITEERHLLSDPQYLEYCQQVKYRFIPKVF